MAECEVDGQMARRCLGRRQQPGVAERGESGIDAGVQVGQEGAGVGRCPVAQQLGGSAAEATVVRVSIPRSRVVAVPRDASWRV
jgi:hypothetical protein